MGNGEWFGRWPRMGVVRAGVKKPRGPGGAAGLWNGVAPQAASGSEAESFVFGSGGELT